MIEQLKTAAAVAASTELTDVEIEAALATEGIYVWGPDGEKFERMFRAVMHPRERELSKAFSQPEISHEG